MQMMLGAREHYIHKIDNKLTAAITVRHTKQIVHKLKAVGWR